MNTKKDKNPFIILAKYDVECYKCHNFGHLEKDYQLKLEKQEEEEAKICGIYLYVKKEEDKCYIDSGCTSHM